MVTAARKALHNGVSAGSSQVSLALFLLSEVEGNPYIPLIIILDYCMTSLSYYRNANNVVCMLLHASLILPPHHMHQSSDSIYDHFLMTIHGDIACHVSDR